MTSIDGYLRSLASSLRWRRIGEESVAAILNEVVAASAESQIPPVDEFGKPAEYARKFDKGSAYPIGWVVGNALAGLALVAGFARSATSISAGGFGFLYGLVTLVVTIGSVFVALLIGQMIDRRLPEGVRR